MKVRKMTHPQRVPTWSLVSVNSLLLFLINTTYWFSLITIIDWYRPPESGFAIETGSVRSKIPNE